MTNLVIGLFKDSKEAGEAVAELKQKGYTDRISVISKDYDQDAIDVEKKVVKGMNRNVEAGTTGALTGGILGLLAGASVALIPGAVVVGPLALTLLGIAGGASLGALTGVLLDMGVPQETVEIYTDRINQGDVVVTVHVDEDKTSEVEAIMKDHFVVQIEEYANA